LAVVWSVERAQYITLLPDLTFITVVAVSAGLLLAKLPAPDVLLFPFGVLVGLPIALWRTALTVTDATGLLAQASTVLQRSNAWWELAMRGGISGDTLPFALLLATLTWLIGFTAAWSVFRYRHPWLALLPSGLGLLVNLSYLPTSFTHLAYLIFQCFFWPASTRRAPDRLAPGLDPCLLHNSIMIDGAWLTVALLLPLGYCLNSTFLAAAVVVSADKAPKTPSRSSTESSPRCVLIGRCLSRTGTPCSSRKRRLGQAARPSTHRNRLWHLPRTRLHLRHLHGAGLDGKPETRGRPREYCDYLGAGAGAKDSGCHDRIGG
jgi:hypothetical protein